MVRRPGSGDDEFALDTASGEHARASGPPRRPPADKDPFWRGPLLWLLCGAVLIAVGVVAAPVPPGPSIGIIDQVGEPEQQWQVDLGYDGMPEDGAEGVVPVPQVWLADQAVLYVEPEQVTALDAADGSQLWQAGGTDLRCELTAPTMLCVSGHDEDAELVHLNLEQGEVARVAEPDLIGAIAHGGGVITVHASNTGVRAARQDATGGQVWSADLHEGRLWPDEVPVHEREAFVNLGVVSDQVMVRIYRGAVTAGGVDTAPMDIGRILDTQTGQPQDLDGAQTVAPVSSGADTHWLLMGAEREPITRIDADGVRHQASGFAESLLLVDDGRHTEVSIELADETLRGVSMRTGRTLWEHTSGDGNIARPLARLGEVLIVDNHGSIEALDLGSGEERWHSAGQQAMNAYSDGQVLVVIANRDGSAAFIGVDAHSGAEQFEVDIGEPWVSGFDSDGRRAVTLTTEGVSLWAW